MGMRHDLCGRRLRSADGVAGLDVDQFPSGNGGRSAAVCALIPIWKRQLNDSGLLDMAQ